MQIPLEISRFRASTACSLVKALALREPPMSPACCSTTLQCPVSLFCMTNHNGLGGCACGCAFLPIGKLRQTVKRQNSARALLADNKIEQGIASMQGKARRRNTKQPRCRLSAERNRLLLIHSFCEFSYSTFQSLN